MKAIIAESDCSSAVGLNHCEAGRERAGRDSERGRVRERERLMNAKLLGGGGASRLGPLTHRGQGSVDLSEVYVFGGGDAFLSALQK